MAKIGGTYVVDLENSAKLAAGFFHDRFVMRPGFDHAIRKFMLDHREAANGISISIDRSRMLIKSLEGEEEFQVIDFDEVSSPGRLVVDWDGKTTFNVVEVAASSIHLQNPHHEVGEWIWRRTRDE